MATEENNVKILTWPKDPAKLEHRFNSEQPCPVTISFGESTAHVVIENSSKNPFNVDMKMNLLAGNTIPVCVKLCEPICVKSDYTIGIDIFDRPVGTIRIKGLSRLFNCKTSDDQTTKPTCVDFGNLKLGTSFENPFTFEMLKFSPLGSPLKVVDLGEPNGRLKLLIPASGMRIDFPMPVNEVVLTINNYSGSKDLTITIFSGVSVLDSITETIDGTVKECQLTYDSITSVEIKGGRNEASLIQVCYRNM